MDATPLHWAACLGDPDLVRFLLERGAQQEDVGGYFGTPLHTAEHCRWLEQRDYDGVIELLKRAGDKSD